MASGRTKPLVRRARADLDVLVALDYYLDISAAAAEGFIEALERGLRSRSPPPGDWLAPVRARTQHPRASFLTMLALPLPGLLRRIRRSSGSLARTPWSTRQCRVGYSQMPSEVAGACGTENSSELGNFPGN